MQAFAEARKQRRARARASSRCGRSRRAAPPSPGSRARSGSGRCRAPRARRRCPWRAITVRRGSRVQSRPCRAPGRRPWRRERGRAACGSAWSCPCRCGPAARPSRRRRWTGHAVQHMALAVVGVQVLRLRAMASSLPRRRGARASAVTARLSRGLGPGMRAARRFAASTDRSSITAPSTITVMRSAMRNTASMSCSTSSDRVIGLAAPSAARACAPTPPRPCPRAARRAAAPAAGSRGTSRSRAGAARRARAWPARSSAVRCRPGALQRRARRACSTRAARGGLPERPGTLRRAPARRAGSSPDRELRKDRAALVAAPEAGPRRRGCGQARHVRAEQLHACRVAAISPDEHVDQRRLAGAVGADHRVHSPCAEVDRHVVDGDQPAEAAGQRARRASSVSVTGAACQAPQPLPAAPARPSRQQRDATR